MKLSELQLGQKAQIKYIGPEDIEYSFKGEVRLHPRDGKPWLSPDNIHGYGINEKFDGLWEVKVL